MRPLLAALLLTSLPARAEDALGDAARDAAELGRKARAVAADSTEPYVAVRLKASPFRGPDGAATRARVEGFARKLGRPLSSYQDNDLLLAVTVKPARPFSDAAFGLADALRRRGLGKALDGLRLGLSRSTDAGWELILQPPLYEPDVRARLAALPEPVDISFYVNKAMSGEIWVRFSVDGLADPKAWAARLAAERPAEVKEAGVYRSVRVMSVTAGGGD